MTHEEIKNIPSDRDVTYTIFGVDFRPRKKRSLSGVMIKYSREKSTRTADLTTTKVTGNCVLSTEREKYTCFDVGFSF